MIMKKLYIVRLFRIMDEVAPSIYDVCKFGTIVVSNKKKVCEEYVHELELPVVDSELEYDNKNYIPMLLVTIPEKKVKDGYFVLKEDFNERNRIKTKKDLAKCNFNSRVNPAMGIIERLKEFECFEKGIEYKKKKGYY